MFVERPRVFASQVRNTVVRFLVLRAWLEQGLRPVTPDLLVKDLAVPVGMHSARQVLMSAYEWGWAFSYEERPPLLRMGRPRVFYQLTEPGAAQVDAFLRRASVMS